MGRSPCCSKVGLRRGPWSAKEDSLLANYIQQHGEGQWRSLPKKAGLLRCGKSCRLRWMNYLRPGIKRGNISQDEEDLIVRLHGLLGNRWSLIAGRLPGRTDNEIKNYWNTHLLKKLINTPTINLQKKVAPPPLPPPPPSPPPPQKKKSNNNKKKKKKTTTTTKSTAAAAAEANQPNNVVNKTKVYLPKPLRVSSVFSRTNSYDSLVSRTSSSEGCADAAEKVAGVVSYVPWPPLLELDDETYAVCQDIGFLGGGGCAPPLLHTHSDSVSGDVDMWEKVYDEYLRLL